MSIERNTSTTAQARPEWVERTCPEWCQDEHRTEHLWDEDAEVHTRRFGDDDLAVGVLIGADGQVQAWDATVPGFDATHADDLEAVAAALHEASAWIRAEVAPRIGGRS